VDAAKVRLALKLLAPYIAVGVFWLWMHDAWLAILAYHLQILFWALEARPNIGKPHNRRILLLALPAAVAGPLLYVLLPHIVREDLSTWLSQHHVSDLSLLLMIPYFGLLHPCLEQIHWGPLRDSTPLAHPMFAGYHMLVLYSLLSTPWLLLCFVVLVVASAIWQQMAKRSGSLTLPALSHILADFGVIVAACIRVLR